MRLRIRRTDWPRRALVLTDTPRPDCPRCHGAGGLVEEYAYPDTGEHWGTGFEPCGCWQHHRRWTLLPLPRHPHRTPPGSYSNEPPF